ncbi:MAG: M1 family aminopeptidase [Bacteroidia bacterium]|nr:M1 family aminopeptidase [Bacteroidia bacterium]
MLRIIQFELQYRLARPATYLYFGVMLILGFMAFGVEDFFSAGSGQVKENAPVMLAIANIAIGALLGVFVVSALMGVAVLRDAQHRTEAMLFTTPLRKRDYIFGRFLGSLIITVLVFFGLPIGIAIGTQMPWLDRDTMLPLNLWHVFQPFFAFVLPMVFSIACLFFAGGTLSRNILFVYLQGIILLGVYLAADTLSRNLERRELMALVDPFILNTQEVVTRYWTVDEQNRLTLPLSGVLLYNRLLWLGIGLLALAASYFGFSFNPERKGWLARRRTQPAAGPKQAPVRRLPAVRQVFGTGTQLRQMLALTGLYYREIVRSLPFIAISTVGLAITALNAPYLNEMYGTNGYPATYAVLELLEGFNFFFILIVIFYTGELIWKERDLRMDQIYDATPAPVFAGLSAKLLGFILVHITLLLILMASGVLIQSAFGYFKFELDVYIKTLFGSRLLYLALFSMLGLFVQAVVNNKFAGHAVFALFFIFLQFMGNIGLEHSLFRFASGSLGSYSDMNAFGHFVPRFAWYKLYWLGLGAVLFALATVFSVRGADTLLRTRLKLARLRFARPLLIFTFSALALFLGSGFYLFFNTTRINAYRSSKQNEKLQAEYEKTLKSYEKVLKPRIVETYVHVEVYPERRDFTAEGYYILKNKSQTPIQDLHIQYNFDDHLRTEYMTLRYPGTEADAAPRVKEAHERFDYYIYELEQPLQPGDSLRMNFKVAFETRGIEEGATNTSIVYNGTFFDNTLFPILGYQATYELTEDNKRKKQGLPPKERLPERNDSLALRSSLFGDNSDHIRFEIVMGTSPEQIAIAPGYLQREWNENGRRYFHYRMDVPMANFYSMVSADYEVRRDLWTAPDGREIPLEIYYHAGHDYNLDRMMKGLRDALTYNSLNFSPYQYRQMRIMEFPRYRSFAQSFANTVPFSEGIGFMLRLDDADPDAVDMAYYVTAHEVGHQWWGHQVMEAGVKGNAMLSETMSQYTALMVMKHAYPQEMMQKFLRYELDRYLWGRATETKKEQPLELVESQGYIHYQKGSIVMYALQDYLGEDSVNAALRRFVRDWAWREDRYPTSADLIGYFRAVTPDSMQYLIHDFFETITLFENRCTAASFAAAGSGYRVSLDLSALKYRADSLGRETEIPVADWIDVGVYGRTEAGRDTLLYLRKHRLGSGSTHLEIDVPQRPHKAGIDPLNKLIDRNPEDNVKELSEGA